MPVKIRLTRQGHKKRPYYHIVIADSRAPRDGRFIERIGSYNPITNPANIELNFDRALYWVQQGAQPTDSCRAILSAKGVMYKKHLLDGVKKGAFSEEEAEKRLNQWLKEKEAKLLEKKSKLEKAKEDQAKKRLDEETKIKEAKAEVIAKKNAEQAAAVKAEETVEEESEANAEAEEATAAAATEESTVETPAEEETPVPAETESKADETPEKPEAEQTEESPEEGSQKSEEK